MSDAIDIGIKTTQTHICLSRVGYPVFLQVL